MNHLDSLISPKEESQVFLCYGTHYCLDRRPAHAQLSMSLRAWITVQGMLALMYQITHNGQFTELPVAMSLVHLYRLGIEAVYELLSII